MELLQLYDKNKNKKAGLTEYKDLCIESVLTTGDKKLSFSYSKEAKYYDEIVEEGYIRTKKDEFVIKARDVGVDYTRFDCVLNLEGLEANIFDRFESVEQTITSSLNLAIVGTGWTVKDNTLKKKRTVRCTNKNALEIVQEIKKTYRVDIVFNTLKREIEVYEHLGEDKGTYFIDSLNLTALQVQSDSYKFATRIIAEGKDGLTFADINGGKNYVENYQYSRKVKTIYWKDERYTIKESLLEDAKAKLKEISKPYTSYSASILNLAKLNPKYKDILDYRLGDTITLISKNNKVKDKQRIVKTVEYPLDHSRDTVELANAVLKFEDIQQENQETTDTVNNITTDNGTIDGSTINGIKVKQIEDFKANVVEVINLKAINANIDNLHANKADIQDLHAVTAKIGTLEATKANITQLNAVNAEISKLNAIKANVTDLNAAAGKINVLESKTASIDNLLAGNLTANNFKANSITASSGIIADGAIGSAQISSLSVNKLDAGEFITSKHKIVSADGTIEIVGNQILINRNNINRVILGEYRKLDNTTEYGLLIRGKDGRTVMFDSDGVHNAGITDGAIDNNKVADNANISGNKLDINSVIREVNNNGTETIKGTKVTIGDRTLDVELSTQKNTITEHSKELSNQKATIQALDSAIKLKVDSQTFTQSTQTINSTINKAKEDAINSAKNYTNSEITTVNSHLNKATSEINILKEKIESKVSQTDIDKSIQNIIVGGRNLFLDSDLQICTKSKNWFDNFKSLVITEDNLNYVTMKGTQWFFGQYVELEEGQTYTVSCLARVNKASQLKSFLLHIKLDAIANVDYVINKACTDNFQRISYTFVWSRANARERIHFLLRDSSAIVDIALIKLEKGNKATDWTPAPEDTDQAIADNIKIVTDKITTVESKLTQENNSIKASVRDLNSTTQSITTNVSNINRELTSKINSNLNAAKSFATDIAINKANEAKQEAINSAKAFVNAEITTVNSKVHNVESNLNILSNEIESKVSQSDIDKSIQEIKIGGRNLVLNSDLSNGLDFFNIIPGGGSGSIEFSEFQGKKCLKFIDISSYRISKYLRFIARGFNKGNNVSLGVDVYITSGEGLCFDTSYNLGIEYLNIDIIEKNKWIRLSKTSSKVTNKDGDISFSLYGKGETPVSGYLTFFKVEEGTKSTDWTPAPEDTNSLIADNIKVVDTKISDVSSSLEQTKNSITQSVNNLQSQTTTLNGKIVNAETRLNSVEAKITDTSIINTVRSQFYSKGETDTLYAKQTQISQLDNKIVAQVSGSGGGNLIKNSNFNGGLDCWQKWGNIGFDTNTSYLTPGYGKMVIIQSFGFNQGIFQRFETIPGETYMVSFYAEANKRQPLETSIGIEGIKTITLKYEPGFKRWNFTFRATAKEHTFIAYCTNGAFFLGRVMVSKGEVLQEYREGNGVYSTIAKIDEEGITIDSLNSNTKTITDANGFKIIDKVTGTNLLNTDARGIVAKGGNFIVERDGNYSLFWGRDININGQRALVGTHSHPEAPMHPNKLYVNYMNDFVNGVDIAGLLTNNGKKVMNESQFLDCNFGFTGHQKLPSGLILQWGRFTVVPGKDDYAISYVNFAKPFPNSTLAVFANIEATDEGKIDWISDVNVNAQIWDNYKFRIVAKNLLHNWGTMYSGYWFAIGH
ncbi:phage tail spike protein [Clostridium perfringens]|uniref:phage tail spike protein n=1 Tax=Clostridium perfringens TaxID=1502 RepID=UPI0039EB72DD